MTVFFSVPEVNSILKVPLGIIFEDKEVNETEPCYFPKNLDGIFSACQDTEIQVVVVGAGRADLVAQTKAVIQRSMEGDDTMVRGYTLWIMDGSYMGVSKNRGFSPQIIHFNRDFHYIPSILGTPIFGNIHMDLSSIQKLTWLDHEDGSPIVIIEYGFSFHHHFF